MAETIQQPFTIQASGTFTPPPAPCGNPECHYEGFEVAHSDFCEEAY